MENASKAVLIAGAILVSILVISISVFIYTKTSGSAKSNIDSLSTIEISEFNSQFTPYEGMQKGSTVKELLQKVITSSTKSYNEINSVEKVPTVLIFLEDSNGIRYNLSIKDKASALTYGPEINPDTSVMKKEGKKDNFDLDLYTKLINGIMASIKINDLYDIKVLFSRKDYSSNKGLVEAVYIKPEILGNKLKKYTYKSGKTSWLLWDETRIEYSY